MNVLMALLFVLPFAQGISIPSSWKTCKQDASLNDCLKGGISSALTDLLPGNPTFNIRKLDPLYLKNATFVFDEANVKMTALYSDVYIIDFVKFIEIESVESDWKTMTVKMGIPKGYRVSSQYHIPVGGTFMGQAIHGDGPCEFHYGSTKMIWQFKFSEKTVAGDAYYNVDEFKFQLDVSSMSYNFTNLFDGDSAQNEKMNKLMNDNWRVYWDPLKRNIDSLMNQVGRHSSNKIFSKIPKNFITPP